MRSSVLKEHFSCPASIFLEIIMKGTTLDQILGTVTLESSKPHREEAEESCESVWPSTFSGNLQSLIHESFVVRNMTDGTGLGSPFLGSICKISAKARWLARRATVVYQLYKKV